jgi:enamine deaminase RidA (YjgF/YER057c/UK114 family)
MKLRHMILAATVLAAASTFAHAQVEVKHIQTAKGFIAQGVWVGDTYYLSGQTADALPPTPGAPASAPPSFGDMKTQAASVFAKIQKSLQAQGLDMKDVVKATVFMAADPATGKLAFAEMNGEFAKYFGTKDQPNKPARSAVQVAALVAPGALLEVEVIAVKSK